MCFLAYFVPRMRDLSKASSELRSHVMGRVVDSYTNILTVKLFARSSDEDAYVREVIDDHTGAIAAHMRLITRFMLTLSIMNALLLVTTAAIGIVLWSDGVIGAGIVATALPLAWQIANVSGWVSWEVTGIFENIGIVQEGMQTIAVPHTLVDRPNASELVVPRGEIRIEHLTFTYGRADGRRVLDDLNLVVRPGERVGLVGRSGAGKSTLVNLLLRFHETEQGSIRIDGQDIGDCTQESLRAAIGMVTQDTSLLHRSIAANIAYGRPGSTPAEIEAAARQAQAHDFILDLVDWKERTGYEAHVGERGVKLSGGQRQRIALSRVILKDAPILILDEATSALDSEVELAIQDQLATLMQGKTVIAIAHRLSTIARMDRLGGAGAGTDRRAGHARRAAAPWRPLRPAVEAPVRRLPAGAGVGRRAARACAGRRGGGRPRSPMTSADGFQEANAGGRARFRRARVGQAALPWPLNQDVLVVRTPLTSKAGRPSSRAGCRQTCAAFCRLPSF
jgi:ATP-binding cassette subfamily B multidrug efflux pump